MKSIMSTAIDTLLSRSPNVCGGRIRIDGTLYAWENRCAHAGGPVCQGKLMNRVVERLDAERRSLGDHFSDELHIVCPWHGSAFCLADGAVERGPATTPQPVYETRVRGDLVEVRPDSHDHVVVHAVV